MAQRLFPRVCSLGLALMATSVLADSVESEAPWWPSQWGRDDQAGATNRMTPAKTLAAVQLITHGKVYSLGRRYEADMPLPADRAFVFRIPGAPTSGAPFGDNGVVYNDDFLATEIGQVGTQLDGLGHIGIADPADRSGTIRFYNGVTSKELLSARGLKRNGIEQLKPIVTRGILIDAAGHNGGMLGDREEISVDRIKSILAWQGLSEQDIQPGDAVLINTGWGKLWRSDNARYLATEPGINLDVAKWLANKEVTLVGADNASIEVMPNPDPNQLIPVHQELLVRNGIVQHENLDLSALSRERVYQFAYIFAPLPVKGATGSPGNPLAIR